MALRGYTPKLLVTVEVLNTKLEPAGKFRINVSVCAMVSANVKVNLSKYCLFTMILDPFELDMETLGIVLGIKLLT